MAICCPPTNELLKLPAPTPKRLRHVRSAGALHLCPACLLVLGAARLRDELKRLQTVELAIADDPFARQSEVDRSVDDAFMKAVRDGAQHGKADERRPKHQKTSRTKMKRASRPNVPKTFGSRSR